MASNILLLASKIVFLTSQGLVGAGMNCRALHIGTNISVFIYIYIYINYLFTRSEF